MNPKDDGLEELFWGSKRTPYDESIMDWAAIMLIMIFFALAAVSGFESARYYYAYNNSRITSNVLYLQQKECLQK